MAKQSDRREKPRWQQDKAKIVAINAFANPVARRSKPKWQQDIASERIEILFREAHLQARAGRLERSNRYVYLARKLAMKYLVRIPRSLRRMFCHSCYHYLLPGKNLEVRTNKKTQAVEYKCLDCRHINRYPYLREKQNDRPKQ